jgi:cell division protein FtsL|tara:strand:- start:320 stop:691 length:372 start_codon:yes stop_codon:yes gene_type:complete
MTIAADFPISRKKTVRTIERTKKNSFTFSIFLGVIISFILLFSVAGSHAFLITVQQEVDSLQSRITEEMGASQELRIQVAELKNPERIRAAAEGRLNMLQPPIRKQIQPVSGLPTPPDNPFRR